MNRRQQQLIEEQEQVRRSREQIGLGLEQVSESLCPKHEWKPLIRAGSLPPPASQCPGCLEDATRAHDTDNRDVRTLLDPRLPHTERQHELMEIWRERERKRHPGKVEPGSEEERAAIEAADSAREEAKERDRPRERGGVLVSQRVEQGVLVEYRAVRGRGIVRVA